MKKETPLLIRTHFPLPAQNVNELLGKILRFDVDHPQSEQIPYSSPDSNPFFGSTPGRDEIYATGLRNPWRFSFDRVTHELYVGDVGQNAVEEVDIVNRGGNYGWRVFEGSQCTNLGPAACDPSKYVAPIAEYTHANGRCSITGTDLLGVTSATFSGTAVTVATGTGGTDVSLPVARPRPSVDF